MMDMALGRIGVWSLELRFGDKELTARAARELERLGYGTIWVPGGVGGDLFGDLDHLLGATSTVAVATGILNIWKHEPNEVVRWWKALPDEHRSRTLLGLGVSHAHSVGEAWKKPLAAMRDYLTRLSDGGLPAESVCLAALGPKMLELAGARTAGVHPYLVTPEHTALARAAMGPDKFVAPEQGVVLVEDAEEARAISRKALEQYRTYPNYMNSWRRLGFSDDEIATVADPLLDALFARGSVEDIGARVQEHFAAGADHVCLQAITGRGLDVDAALAAWRQLAPLASD